MNPGLRKLVLTAHITLSVGWLGAVVAYLALAIAGLATQDPQAARAAYLSMGVIGWYVIVPFGIAALVAGLVEALGTPWGLFRHWWVLVKFLLTTVAVIVLLNHMQAVTRMAGIAQTVTLTAGDFRALRTQLLIHPAGGLLVLLTTTVLSVYKPWGLTPFGLREREERRNVAPARIPSAPGASVGVGSSGKAPRWTLVVGVHAIGLALILLVVHLAGGMRAH